jgi:tRNA pseudouridine65 synthase
MSAAPALSILYRDASLLAVNKPSGLAVHRGHARERIAVLQLARAGAGRWVYPVHRLDERQLQGVERQAVEPEAPKTSRERTWYFSASSGRRSRSVRR